MRSSPNPPLARASLADLVYERLLDQILSSARPSGSALVIADIAKELQVSPSPVREAVLRLAAEGLATNATNRRAAVVRFTEREAADIFQVREMLECGAARLAAPKCDPSKVQLLRDAADYCAALAGQPEQKKVMLDRDNQFHILIAQITENAALVEEIVRISHRVRVIQWLWLDPRAMKLAYAEHVAIVDALARNDADAAAEAMSLHVRSAAHSLFVRYAANRGSSEPGAGR